jgi:hypothetical protein
MACGSNNITVLTSSFIQRFLDQRKPQQWLALESRTGNLVDCGSHHTHESMGFTVHAAHRFAIHRWRERSLCCEAARIVQLPCICQHTTTLTPHAPGNHIQTACAATLKLPSQALRQGALQGGTQQRHAENDGAFGPMLGVPVNASAAARNRVHLPLRAHSCRQTYTSLMLCSSSSLYTRCTMRAQF